MARYGLSLLLALLLPMGSLAAAQQEWSAIQKATGWASFDRDGTCNFYDPASKKLINWSWDGGVLGQLDLSKASFTPEKWVVDSRNNVWTVAGTVLQFIEKNGHAGSTQTLPAEVGDLAWDTRSFVLCYRTRELYLEKRDLKTGAVLWAYGVKPAKGAPFAQVLHHLAIKEDGQVLVSSGPSLTLSTFDGDKGKLLDTTSFTNGGAEVPPLALGRQDRGAILWGLGTTLALTAVPASQLPSLKLEGLILVKLDLADRTATYVPTGLAEGHLLVGLLEKVVVFRAPNGGLAFISLD